MLLLFNPCSLNIYFNYAYRESLWALKCILQLHEIKSNLCSFWPATSVPIIRRKMYVYCVNMHNSYGRKEVIFFLFSFCLPWICMMKSINENVCTLVLNCKFCSSYHCKIDQLYADRFSKRASTVHYSICHHNFLVIHV